MDMKRVRLFLMPLLLLLVSRGITAAASPEPIKPCPLLERGPVRMVALSEDGTKQHLIRFTVVGFTYSPLQNLWLLSARTKFEFDQGLGDYRVFYRNEGYFIANGSRQFRFVIELFGGSEFTLSVECPNETRLSQGSYEIMQKNRIIESGSLRFFAANKAKRQLNRELQATRQKDAAETPE
jgi:hypothetical protein